MVATAAPRAGSAVPPAVAAAQQRAAAALAALDAAEGADQPGGWFCQGLWVEGVGVRERGVFNLFVVLGNRSKM